MADAEQGNLPPEAAQSPWARLRRRLAGEPSRRDQAAQMRAAQIVREHPEALAEAFVGQTMEDDGVADVREARARVRILIDGLYRLVDGETRARIAQLADTMIDQRLNQSPTEQTVHPPTGQSSNNTEAPAA